MRTAAKIKIVFLVSLVLGFGSLVYADEASSTPEIASSTPLVIVEEVPPVLLEPDTITLTIRDGSVTAFSGTVELAATTTPDTLVTPTAGGEPVSISARSLLATLLTLDTENDSFEITQYTYYPAYASFLIDCIAVPASSTSPHCFNWTYAVNGSYPFDGVDDKILAAGDTAHFFFGPQRKVILSTTTVEVDTPFTATASNYDLATGEYVAAPGFTIGAGTANPDFSFTEIATGTADALGQVVFTLHATGTFSVGIKEDFYFPSESILITGSATTSEPVSDEPVPSSSGGGGTPAPTGFNIPRALAFIASHQTADGSFTSPIVTDWAALAFAAGEPGVPKQLLRTYLLTSAPAFTNVTDNERHALALEALDINPYTGTSHDYITPIVAAFDGIEIKNSPSDAGIVNDDIFGLIALLHAGYSSSDALIKQEAAFVLSKQHADGSWDGIPDMTAAAIQALGPLFDVPGVNQALGKASRYLASTEQQDGSWGNIDSTSWVQTAINGIIEAHTPGLETESAWRTSAGNLPTDALAAAQLANGSVSSADPTWSTSYAVVAASGKSWVSLLHSFPKISPVSGGGSSGSESIALSIATSSERALATSTPMFATSTARVLGAATSTDETTLFTIPSTTPNAATSSKKLPKLKKVSVAHRNSAQQIPSPATTTPHVLAQSAPTEHTGFFGSIWHTIARFLRKLF